VNFFGHAAIACWHSPAPPFVLGAMLPDFAAMIRARPPDSLHEKVSSGIRFHHRTDHVFHDTPSFRALSAAAFTALSELGLRRGSARAVAHIGVEILIDAALARDSVARNAYLDALGAADEAELGREILWRDSSERVRFAGLREALLTRGVGDGGVNPELVAWRVSRALAGRSRLALEGGEQAAVERWVERSHPSILARASELIDELGQGLGPQNLQVF
jgi:hypothetical protein